MNTTKYISRRPRIPRIFVIVHGKTHAVAPALLQCIGGSFFHVLSPRTKYSTVFGGSKSKNKSLFFREFPPKTTIVFSWITAAKFDLKL